ncbi:MAG: DNA alkylation repair protein [Bacillales bacterium]|nr:DNA alkylation repair protein [Bacillales bacterium]
MSEFLDNLLKDYIDSEYAAFSAPIVNSSYKVKGVRSPDMKKIIKKIGKENSIEVLKKLDDESFEEINIYFSLLPYYLKDEEILKAAKERISLYCDSWAVTDSAASTYKFIGKDLNKYYPEIKKMLQDENIWVIRFAIVLTMNYYPLSEMMEDLLNDILNIKSEEYYIMMAKAWLFSVLFVKRKEMILPHIESNELTGVLRKQTIRKCLDSFRISEEDKEYLKKIR